MRPTSEPPATIGPSGSTSRLGRYAQHGSGPIDWPRVAGDDVDLAYIKATEGATWTDPRLRANWTGARAAGLGVGAYHFFTFCRAGADQAANFLGALAGLDQTRMLNPVVDVEEGGNCANPPEHAAIERELRVFVAAVEKATGQRVMVCALDGWSGVAVSDDGLPRPVWRRSLLWRPNGDWSWWQVNNRARVAGIHGPTDLNVAGPRPRRAHVSGSYHHGPCRLLMGEARRCLSLREFEEFEHEAIHEDDPG